MPQTVTNGEFSMDIEGLRANAPGDKANVMGMQKGQDDVITNRYRVDTQYRGTGGSPPNPITFRALFGSGRAIVRAPVSLGSALGAGLAEKRGVAGHAPTTSSSRDRSDSSTSRMT